MRVKVLFENKKGSSRLLERNFEIIKDLIQKYPNALWRRYNKNGQTGYELQI
ncbi:hypothetical protein J4466_02895 [Candidatus Pacearchaeota archaeon]|nr:hypothetical protein [Candidatus Pacearchaeota archaeon]